MNKIYFVLPLGQHPFNKDYIYTRSSESFDTLKQAEDLALSLAKNYQGIEFIVVQSIKQIKTIYQILE